MRVDTVSSPLWKEKGSEERNVIFSTEERAKHSSSQQIGEGMKRKEGT